MDFKTVAMEYGTITMAVGDGLFHHKAVDYGDGFGIVCSYVLYVKFFSKTFRNVSIYSVGV